MSFVRARGICFGGLFGLWAAIFPAAAKADTAPAVNLRSHFFKDKLGPETPCNPAITLRFSSGPVVGVCRGIVAPLENGTTFYTVHEDNRFLLTAATASGKASVLWHPDRHGLTQFGIQRRPDDRIQLLETIQDGTSTYMLFQRELVCDGETCALGDAQCSWDLLNTLYPHAILDFNRDLDKAPADFSPGCPKEDAEDCPLDPTSELLKKDMEHLFLAGLAGDGAARARLHAIPKDFSDRLNIRMTAKDALVKRARDLKCID